MGEDLSESIETSHDKNGQNNKHQNYQYQNDNNIVVLLTYIPMPLQSKQNVDFISCSGLYVHTSCITQLIYYFYSIWFASGFVETSSHHTGNSSENVQIKICFMI